MKCPLTGSCVDDLVTRWERNYRLEEVRQWRPYSWGLFTGPEVDSGICHSDEKPGWHRMPWRRYGDVRKCVSRVEPHLKNSRAKSVFENHSKLSAKDKTDELYTAK